MEIQREEGRWAGCVFPGIRCGEVIYGIHSAPDYDRLEAPAVSPKRSKIEANAH